MKIDERIELIFVDGGSNDESVQIATHYYQNIVSEPDDGIYSAMNKGLRLARGRYVVWLNSGDEFRPGALKSALIVLQKATADIVAFGTLVFDKIDDKSGWKWTPAETDLPRCFFPHASTFFRRESFLEFGSYREDLRIVADRELMLRFHAKGATIECHDLVLANYYRGGISSTSILTTIENNRVDWQYGLIGAPKYAWRVIRIKNEWLLGPIKRIFLGGL
jgi:glycosyltransferase involved in cell wall biosynthesis